MEKRFTVFMENSRHLLLKVAASSRGVTMNEYVNQAIEEKLTKDGALDIVIPNSETREKQNGATE